MEPSGRRLAMKICPGCQVNKPRDQYYLYQGQGEYEKIGATCKECVRVKSRLHRQGVRETVLAAYGRQCACCGENEEAFLTLDHVNGDGVQDRITSTGTRGRNQKIWALVAREGPSDRYQLLCWNCNTAKHFRGACPHQGIHEKAA